MTFLLALRRQLRGPHYDEYQERSDAGPGRATDLGVPMVDREYDPEFDQRERAKPKK